MKLRQLRLVGSNPRARAIDPQIQDDAEFRTERAQRVLDGVTKLQADSARVFGADDPICVVLLARYFERPDLADRELIYDMLALAVRRLAAK